MAGITALRRKKIAAACFAFAMILWCLAGSFLIASAEETKGSLTLWCVKDDDKVVGMDWHLYRVGHRVNDDYIFEGDFAGYRATLGDKTKPMLEWDADTVAVAGDTLKIHTIAKNIPARDNGTTNNQGAVTFSGLEDGLYLVWGDILQSGDTTYIPSAIFFEMNGEDTAVLNAYPKIVLRTLNDDDIFYSVRKVWENDDSQPWNRATYITVERYRDNQLYDEVVLNEENDWTFTWNDSSEHTWLVYEKVIPPNYTVSYKDNHVKYLIINTFDDDSEVVTGTTTTVTQDGTNTSTETTTTSAESTTAAGTSTSSGSAISTSTVVTGSATSAVTARTTAAITVATKKATTAISTTENKVPQTGQLWWPVPVLAGGGILMLGLGVSLRKKDDDE